MCNTVLGCAVQGIYMQVFFVTKAIDILPALKDEDSLRC